MMCRSDSSPKGFLASSFPLESLDVQEKEAAPSDDDDEEEEYGLFIEEMDPATHDGTASQISALATQCLDTPQQQAPPSDDDDDNHGFFIEELVPIKGEQQAEAPQGAALTAAAGLPDGLPPLQIWRSSIKKVSSYGAMELLGDNIPISLKKNAFKVLPAPSMKKSESLASFFNPTTVPLKKRVCFHNIHVRDYDQTIGDNPSCSYGTPVSLDWNYQENEALNIDVYEGNRLRRRSLRDMHLNYYQRKHLLSLRHSEDEIKEGKKTAEKLKHQRSITKLLAPLMKLESIVESAGRKARRALKKKNPMAKKCLSTGNLVLDDESNVSARSVDSRKTV